MTEATTIARILVPLDGSDLAEVAIPYAAALATSDTEIVFLQVTSDAEAVRDLLGRVAITPDEAAEVDREKSLHTLNAAASRWASILPSTPKVETVSGDAAEQIIDYATSHHADLIVAASRGRGAVGRLTFGSVADRLSRAATTPVLIVRPGDALDEIAIPILRRVLVPYDGSELAGAALPMAAGIAKHLGAPVQLVRVISPTAATPIPTPMEPYYPAAVYEGIMDEIEDEAKTSLREASEKVTQLGAVAQSQVVIGAPALAIQELTQLGDIIVMTSHGRSGFKRWLIGSVAEQLVREGKAPVVIVRSAGAE